MIYIILNNNPHFSICHLSFVISDISARLCGGKSTEIFVNKKIVKKL